METNTMNTLKCTASWVIASLLATTTLFSQDNLVGQNNRPRCKSFEQGQRLAHSQMMPGYNALARVDVRGSWDLFVEGSFIYWQLSQDNMEAAFVNSLDNSLYTANAPVKIKGNYVAMDFDYKPGFKVGIGMNFDLDNWNTYSEYTRIHASNHTSTNGVEAAPGVLAPIFSLWGNRAIQAANAYNDISEKWNCHLDIADIDLGRTYYVGTSLTFRSAFGARAAWILQNVHVHEVNNSFSNAVAPVEVPGVKDTYNRSHSWAIGPKVELNANWIMGQGFRFFGNSSADLLYTKYKVQTKTAFIATGAVATAPVAITPGMTEFFVGKERVSALRPHLDLEMGFGWGSYFDNNNWHIDFSAAYGFQVFFNQNMFPHFDGSGAVAQQQLGTGNLYAQGLTATARLDF